MLKKGGNVALPSASKRRRLGPVKEWKGQVLGDIPDKSLVKLDKGTRKKKGSSNLMGTSDDAVP